MKLYVVMFLIIVAGGSAPARGGSFSDSVKVYNAGINGNSTTNLLARLERDVLAKNPEVVVLMAGTNDMLHEKKTHSIAQYEANLQQLIATIRKKSDLVLMTIPPIYAPYVVQRKPQFNGDVQAPVARIDSANAVVRRLANKNGCVLIDLNTILTACGGATTERDGLFQNEANSGIADGVHPNAAGYKVIATALYQTLRSHQPGVRTVVCFGDSITRGYRMNGEGTTDGDPYPAVLMRMLNP